MKVTQRNAMCCKVYVQSWVSTYENSFLLIVVVTVDWITREVVHKALGLSGSRAPEPTIPLKLQAEGLTGVPALRGRLGPLVVRNQSLSTEVRPTSLA